MSDGARAQELHRAVLLAAGPGRHEVVKAAELSCSNFRGRQVPAHLCLSLVAQKCVHEKCSHRELTVLLGKKRQNKRSAAFLGLPNNFCYGSLEVGSSPATKMQHSANNGDFDNGEKKNIKLLPPSLDIFQPLS